MKKILYTTTEYLDALKKNPMGNEYHCHKKEFIFWGNPKSADDDAQWLVDHYKKDGKKIKKPAVLKITFEKVKK